MRFQCFPYKYNIVHSKTPVSPVILFYKELQVSMFAHIEERYEHTEKFKFKLLTSNVLEALDFLLSASHHRSFDYLLNNSIQRFFEAEFLVELYYMGSKVLQPLFNMVL